MIVDEKVHSSSSSIDTISTELDFTEVEVNMGHAINRSYNNTSALQACRWGVSHVVESEKCTQVDEA